MFSFEAGRRCDSGEGVFAFGSARAQDLCQAVAAAIARQRDQLPDGPGARPVPLPRAASLPSLDAPGELREAPPAAPQCAPLPADPGPRSLPLLLGAAPLDEPAAGLYATVHKGAADPLYENLQGLEGSHGRAAPASPGSLGHGRAGEAPSWPGTGPDAGLEAQYRRLLEQELADDDGDEAAAAGRLGLHSGFKAKLVTLLSRERRKGPP